MSSDITILKTNGYSVTLHTTSVGEDWLREVNSYSKGRSDATAYKGYKRIAVERMLYTRTFDIAGYITSESGTAATTQRTDFINEIIAKKGLVGFTYLGEAIVGEILHVAISETPRDETTPTSFSVRIRFIECTYRTTGT